jgi:hypothetical protein
VVYQMRLLTHHPPNHVRVCHLKNLPTNNAVVQAVLRVVLHEDMAEATEYGPACGSQCHNALVLGWDGQVDEGQARQVPPVLLAAIAGGARTLYQLPLQTMGIQLCLCPMSHGSLDFLFSPLFSGIVPTLPGDALLDEYFLLEQNNKPTLPALLPPMLPRPPALFHMSPCTRVLSYLVPALPHKKRGTQ